MDFLLGRFSGVAGSNGSTSRRDVAREVETTHSSSDFIRVKDSGEIGVLVLGFDSVPMFQLLGYVK